MKMVKYILLLSLSLLAEPLLAQEYEVSSKGNSNGMGDQDYQIQRERILTRMKAASPQNSRHISSQESKATEEQGHGGTYGQGYGSRKDAKEISDNKPTVDISRPERPERPPHIERPGRP